MINVKIFFQSIRLSWNRRYVFGTGPANMDPSPLEDHWCDLLDGALGIKPNERLSILNRGSEWLNSKLKVDHPCLSEILRTLQAIQRKWVTPPSWGDNHWEFQPLFYNPNINCKKKSKNRGYLIPEDFGLKPDFHLLNLKLTNLCLKEKIETRSNRLSKVFGPQVSNWFGIKRLQSFISSLPEKEPLKFPSLPIQSLLDEGRFWEELSNLFVNTVRGGKTTVKFYT